MDVQPFAILIGLIGGWMLSTFRRNRNPITLMIAVALVLAALIISSLKPL